MNFGQLHNGIIRQMLEARMLGQQTADKAFNEMLHHIKSSELLKNQFMAYQNLEEGSFSDEEAAEKYLLENINIFRGRHASSTSVLKENAKLRSLYAQHSLVETPADASNLHDAINYLLTHDRRLDNIQEYRTRLDVVKDHLLTNKAASVSADKDIVEGFNEKYGALLDEEEKKIFQITLRGTEEELQDHFNGLREETLDLISDALLLEDDRGVKRQLIDVRRKTKALKPTRENIVKLYDLKKGLSADTQ